MEQIKEVIQPTRAVVNFLRHSGWVGPEDLTDTLHIIGCGAVGSHIAVLAAKMGFHNFHLWDADQVESHNLANQAYDVEHVGLNKVDALAQVLKRFNPEVKVTTTNRFFTSENDKETLKGVLVIATDSMRSRADIYDAFATNIDIEGVFEVRLGFDYGECHIVNPQDITECIQWKNTLVDDSQVEEGPCNLRICTTLVQLVSSYTVHMICSSYAAKRQHKEWSFTRKKLFSLTDDLKVLSLK